MRSLSHFLLLATTAVCCASDAVSPEAQPSKPHIVFILADDPGYGELACFGGQDVKTPIIDSLARDGMKLTSFYVHQRCSPSRLSADHRGSTRNLNASGR